MKCLDRKSRCVVGNQEKLLSENCSGGGQFLDLIYKKQKQQQQQQKKKPLWVHSYIGIGSKDNKAVGSREILGIL